MAVSTEQTLDGPKISPFGVGKWSTFGLLVPGQSFIV